MNNSDIYQSMQIKLDDQLPPDPQFKPGIRRAPKRALNLTKYQMKIALSNALRYIPEKLHQKLAPEFLEELHTRGRIYGYRYRPQGEIKGKPVDQYKGILEARALQVNIDT